MQRLEIFSIDNKKSRNKIDKRDQEVKYKSIQKDWFEKKNSLLYPIKLKKV